MPFLACENAVHPGDRSRMWQQLIDFLQQDSAQAALNVSTELSIHNGKLICSGAGARSRSPDDELVVVGMTRMLQDGSAVERG